MITLNDSLKLRARKYYIKAKRIARYLFKNIQKVRLFSALFQNKNRWKTAALERLHLYTALNKSNNV